MTFINKNFVKLSEFCTEQDIPKSRMRKKPFRNALKKVGRKIYVDAGKFNSILSALEAPAKAKGGRKRVTASESPVIAEGHSVIASGNPENNNVDEKQQ